MRHQRTVRRAIVLSGQGIHSGEKVKLKIKDAPVDTGIIFIRSDLEKRPAIAAAVSNLSAYSGDLRCTSIEEGSASVHTIEHLMSAMNGLDIDNALVEIDNKELPALDGSARDYALELQKAGSLEQEKEKKELCLKEAILCREGGAVLLALPSEGFSVSFLLKYNESGFAAQCADFSFDSDQKKRDTFVKDIAPARTYCLENEVRDIMKKGLGRGASYENALVIRDGKPIENKFRFVNEPVRHKILDLLGDMALLNADLKAYIIGIRSGHSLNAQLLRKLEKLL